MQIKTIIYPATPIFFVTNPKKNLATLFIPKSADYALFVAPLFYLPSIFPAIGVTIPTGWEGRLKYDKGECVSVYEKPRRGARGCNPTLE